MLDKPVKRVGTLLFKGGRVYVDGWELAGDDYMCREVAIQACLYVAEQLLAKARLDIASPGGDGTIHADMPPETPREWLCEETREFLRRLDAAPKWPPKGH